MGRDEKRAPLKTLAWEANERVAAVRRFADFIFEDNERFLLFLVRLKTSNSAAELYYLRHLYSKTKRKPAKKSTVLRCYINLESTCKNSAHLDEKKKKKDREWLRPDLLVKVRDSFVSG